MAAYRRVYDSRHLQADCQELGLAPEPYARYLYHFKCLNVIRSTFRMLMFAFLQQHFSRPWSLDIKVKLLLRSMLKLPSSVPHAIDPIENNKSRTVKRPLTLSCETYGYLACCGALHWPFPIPQRAEVKKQSQPEWLHTKMVSHLRTSQAHYCVMLCIRGTSYGPVSICRLSVCPSVTSRCSTKTAKRSITQTTPQDCPGTLVF